jgi:Sulfotransferase family
MVLADPFFVVGCPRSGTTLLSVLLDRHSRLCVPPETGFFAEVAPKLRGVDGASLLDTLRGWPRLPELNLTPAAVLRHLGGRPSSPAGVLTAILELYAEAEGKARCGEKTPQHLLHVPTILRLFPAARIVCLLRDGRDVALSLRAVPWGPPTLADAAELWKTFVRLADGFAEQHPSQFTLVYYERLVKHPDQVLPDVMAFLGERFEPRQLQPHRSSGVVLPRSFPWKGQALGPIDPTRIGKRRNEATEGEKAMLDEVVSDELRRHGYM